MLTVGELKKLIQELPDGTLVLRSGPSAHEYSEVSGEVTTTLYDKGSHTFSEDFGEEVTPEAEHGKRVRILLIG